MSWTDAEIEYLREHYPTTRSEDVAIALGKTVNAVSKRAYDLGIRKTKDGWRKICQAGYLKRKPLHGKPKLWTATDDEILRLNYGVMPFYKIAEALGRSPGAVTARVIRLGLNESKWTEK